MRTWTWECVLGNNSFLGPQNTMRIRSSIRRTFGDGQQHLKRRSVHPPPARVGLMLRRALALEVHPAVWGNFDGRCLAAEVCQQLPNSQFKVLWDETTTPAATARRPRSSSEVLWKEATRPTAYRLGLVLRLFQLAVPAANRKRRTAPAVWLSFRKVVFVKWDVFPSSHQ